ncbi:hypothetical protein BTW07_12200 [Salinicola socius]|uniref:Uncharacterized protein n=1 Tax=Salinicola socius TaxID=404433 RepID=A0A1Q8SRK0_9GAMM|nr:hypothetical protein BTW07_12200 [Salinicola socius]
MEIYLDEYPVILLAGFDLKFFLCRLIDLIGRPCISRTRCVRAIVMKFTRVEITHTKLSLSLGSCRGLALPLLMNLVDIQFPSSGSCS